ncbi:MAG: hypothetical protein KR126chlam5_00916 [Candidatus Anoxychlamydiales bacterium]|nr:hypothetical protein [Candidatus Anoxychlamydiales bacterium]
MCMNGLGALAAVVAGAVVTSATVGTIGAVGLSKKVYSYVKGGKKQDSTNNKIQSITATIFSLGAGLALSIVSPAFLYIGLGLSLALNAPHIAKLITKNKETKEKLDNIAGVAAASFNALGLIPLVLLVAL